MYFKNVFTKSFEKYSMLYSIGIFVAMKPYSMYFLKCFMNFIKKNPFVTGIYYGSTKRTWCKYTLICYSDILSRYSGLLSRHGDLVKSLFSNLSRYIDLSKSIYQLIMSLCRLN